MVFDFSNPTRLSRLQAETAFHYVLGLERWLDRRWVLRLEAYYKHMRDLLVQSKTVRPVWRAEPLPGTETRPNDPSAYRIVQRYEEVLEALPVNAGRGRAYGIELVVEKRRSGPQDRLNGWMSYAYAHAYQGETGIGSPSTTTVAMWPISCCNTASAAPGSSDSPGATAPASPTRPPSGTSLWW